jgi:thiol-disulfide isomerase/thioredoxin
MKKYIYATIILIALGLTASYVHFRINKKTTAEVFGLIGQKLPYFSFKDINNNTITSDQLKGKPVVINLWFTTCKPCIAEIPLLNSVKKENKDDVVFLAMALDDANTINKFLSKRAFDFIIIPSATEYSEKLTSSYPTTLFIDKKGIIRDITMGAPLPGKGLEEANRDFINSFKQSIKKII